MVLVNKNKKTSDVNVAIYILFLTAELAGLALSNCLIPISCTD
jgi:hypothetical protein